MPVKMTGAEIRQSFIDFFTEKNHTFVPSSSLVPGGDQTLLFTNAGMVQFKEVFLGTDKRPYRRATNSQKCMRVAGKHNDLDDVGRDDTHHTFFEMLGNWSFGDYYKDEAIQWAWELLTERWGLDKSVLWTTCFKDEKNEIPTDEEAASTWRKQPGIDPTHVLYFGRKENFWEMAETGPCGPCSEIHIDLGPKFCNRKDEPGHVCSVNGNCRRFMELWNLVFIQYNRINAKQLDPLPERHVDTGMGLERIVSVMQGVDSNYKTDLLSPMLDEVQRLTGHSSGERSANLTPYRVVADHARAATFLISDGVVPGNLGRNYICRMIIRRAARFGSKIGLNEPFLAKIADQVIKNYQAAYPELGKNRETILTSITREEERFQRTVETGLSVLEDHLAEMKSEKKRVLDGAVVFDLYATHGLPLEITRDIVREQGFEVDENGFRKAMEEHRLASGAGKVFGKMGGEDVDIYRDILEKLQSEKLLGPQGVAYDPYSTFDVEGKILALVHNGEAVNSAAIDDDVEVVLPRTCFYVESGGQVSDTGLIRSMENGNWEIEVTDTRKPAAGVIIHAGKVKKGKPQVGDAAVAEVDLERRWDIMRNHTATHLLHSKLRKVLGNHARQAGSLVAPDRLRFDFTHPDALTSSQLETIERMVNEEILENYRLKITTKALNDAISEGATALFGEKYGDVVRTIAIGGDTPFSYELCGGTHVTETGDLGSFLIASEGSAAAGIRRIEAVTGRKAYDLIQKRFRDLKTSAALLNAPVDEVTARIQNLMEQLDEEKKEVARIRQEMVGNAFSKQLEKAEMIADAAVLAVELPSADADTLRNMSDQFRDKYKSGVFVAGSIIEGRPLLIASVTDDLVKKRINAGEIVRTISKEIDGSGGGRPNLAQAGGKNPAGLQKALELVMPIVKSKLG
ncbi:MAG: alanine--tRNA ligase [Leptolinea sp.]|jgi:alanyl-tRNA synthetase|nr:alanine--tRNA ligase [Leptolinea sp.]